MAKKNRPCTVPTTLNLSYMTRIIKVKRSFNSKWCVTSTIHLKRKAGSMRHACWTQIDLVVKWLKSASQWYSNINHSKIYILNNSQKETRWLWGQISVRSKRGLHWEIWLTQILSLGEADIHKSILAVSEVVKDPIIQRRILYWLESNWDISLSHQRKFEQKSILWNL